MRSIYLVVLVACAAVNIRAAVADLVVFSYDRPLQLYALLESIEKHVKGIGEAAVIYRVSDMHYEGAYALVQQRFSGVKFIMQGENPREDFKPLTLQTTFDTPSEYVIFAVDDIVVKDDVNLSTCIALLEHTKAYGFYLNLGDHLNFCYPMNQAQRLPEFMKIQDNVYSWRFGQGECGWAYPYTVDMAVYKKKDIELALRSIDYYSPNSLEGRWADQAIYARDKQGLCFKSSKVVNLPLNKVQHEIDNRSMEISASCLLETFLQGYRLDIEPLFQIKNVSAHMEYEPTFIKNESVG